MSRATHKQLGDVNGLVEQLVERIDALEAKVAKLEKAAKTVAKADDKGDGKTQDKGK